MYCTTVKRLEADHPPYCEEKELKIESRNTFSHVEETWHYNFYIFFCLSFFFLFLFPGVAIIERDSYISLHSCFGEEYIIVHTHRQRFLKLSRHCR